jgi:hypothetical protein
VVHTNGIDLSAAQASRMNQLVGERGLGLGAILVHELTNTDINQMGLV